MCTVKCATDVPVVFMVTDSLRSCSWHIYLSLFRWNLDTSSIQPIAPGHQQLFYTGFKSSCSSESYWCSAYPCRPYVWKTNTSGQYPMQTVLYIAFKAEWQWSIVMSLWDPAFTQANSVAHTHAGSCQHTHQQSGLKFLISQFASTWVGGIE